MIDHVWGLYAIFVDFLSSLSYMHLSGSLTAVALYLILLLNKVILCMFHNCLSVQSLMDLFVASFLRDSFEYFMQFRSVKAYVSWKNV